MNSGILFFIGAAFTFSSLSAWSADLYVSNSGNDSNPGTLSAPFKTIQKAASLATAGTTVHVASGIYPELITTSASGTATARIRYLSEIRGGAKIVPPTSGATRTTGWHNRGSYIDIEGFDIDGQNGSMWWSGLVSDAAYVSIKNNIIENIATTPEVCTATGSNGGAAVVSDNYYGGHNSDVIGNVVHNIGSAGCTIIHGLYIVSSGRVANNVVYNIGGTALHSWHEATDIQYVNNTVYNAELGLIIGGSKPDRFYVANNIVMNTRQGILEESSTSTYGANVITNNLVFGSRQVDYNLFNKHSNDVTGDPQFVNAAGGDFRLKDTSPAIDRGAVLNAPSDDLVGNLRPQGAGIDIGALEFLVSIAPAPAPAPAPTPTPTPVPTPVDTIAPSIQLTNPLDGSVVRRGSVVTMKALATDNVAVTKIEFYVNGSLLCTSTSASASCAFTTSGRRNKTYILEGRAYDAAGNKGTSNRVTITAK